MSRAVQCLLLAAAVLLASAAIPEFSRQSVTRAQSGVAGLKDRLEKGLKARRPVEFQFIAKVVAAVEAGKLPEEVVDKIFFWARKKNPVRPFQHFQFALVKEAKQFGVLL